MGGAHAEEDEVLHGGTPQLLVAETPEVFGAEVGEPGELVKRPWVGEVFAYLLPHGPQAFVAILRLGEGFDVVLNEFDPEVLRGGVGIV